MQTAVGKNEIRRELLSEIRSAQNVLDRQESLCGDNYLKFRFHKESLLHFRESYAIVCRLTCLRLRAYLKTCIPDHFRRRTSNGCLYVLDMEVGMRFD